jgi:opacity protein-like surface antigen
MPDDQPRLAAHGAAPGRRMRPMRWVICALVVLLAPAGARAGDYDVLRGAQPVGYTSYTRWSGFYGGGLIGEEFDAADFRKLGTSEITTIAGLSGGFDGIPLSNFPRLTSLNTEAPSYSAFIGYNYQFEAAIVGFELTFTKTSFSASINDMESHSYFQTANGVVYDTDYNVNTSASAKVTDYGTVRGRFGWAFGNFLPYGFGGVAISQIDVTKSVNVNYCGAEEPYSCANPPPASIPPPPANIGGSFTLSDQVSGKWYFGYVAGLGLDYALTQNLFLRAEYQYIQFGAPDNIRLSASSVRAGVGVKF